MCCRVRCALPFKHMLCCFVKPLVNNVLCSVFFYSVPEAVGAHRLYGIVDGLLRDKFATAEFTACELAAHPRGHVSTTPHGTLFYNKQSVTTLNGVTVLSPLGIRLGCFVFTDSLLALSFLISIFRYLVQLLCVCR